MRGMFHPISALNVFLAYRLAEIPRILRLGLPIGALLGLEVGLFATTGVVMGLLGADALGAHQLVLNVASITFMVPLGLGQAATVRVAFQLGMGAPAAARRAAYVAVALGLAVVATALMVRLHFRARAQLRAAETPLIAARGLPA